MLRLFRNHLLIFAVLVTTSVSSQTYPTFGPEIDVTINGLTFDAMEPFISADGNYLFFNSLNDGVNTKLFYATKVNDSIFNYVGEVNGTNQVTPPFLDAVPDMDTIGNFYWTSTRNYPAVLNNLFHGTISVGNVTNIKRVYGDFNKYIPGWLIMDHGISYNGELLYYNNARFDSVNCQGPCETELGIAQKINDSTFNKTINSDAVLQNINDVNYIYYAPCISSDNLELYYTRYLNQAVTSSTLFEICVAVRNTPTDNFSLPVVLFSDVIGELIEAPTLIADKKIIYYHRKIIGSHKIVMRYRDSPLEVDDLNKNKSSFTIYPNPATDKIIIKSKWSSNKYTYEIEDFFGRTVIDQQKIASSKQEINVSELSNGIYFIQLLQENKIVEVIRFIKE